MWQTFKATDSNVTDDVEHFTQLTVQIVIVRCFDVRQVHTKLKETQVKTQEPLKTLCTPNVCGLSEKLEKVCNALVISTAFKPVKTLRQTLMKVKKRVPEDKRIGVVYEVPCKDCSSTYVRETKRKLKVRLEEHRQAVKRGDPKNQIPVHAHNTQHANGWMGQK